MSNYINVKQENTAAISAKPWIPLNRWGAGEYSLNIIITGVATVDVEGTLKKLNQASDTTDPAAGTPAADDIFTISGATGLTATIALSLFDTPLEAIRVNQTAGAAGTVDFHVLQKG